jgi:hypothetical protein
MKPEVLQENFLDISNGFDIADGIQSKTTTNRGLITNYCFSSPPSVPRRRRSRRWGLVIVDNTVRFRAALQRARE